MTRCNLAEVLDYYTDNWSQRTEGDSGGYRLISHRKGDRALASAEVFVCHREQSETQVVTGLFLIEKAIKSWSRSYRLMAHPTLV